MASLSKEHKELLEKQHYEIVGNHSAVEICSWAKKSLLDKGFCYKQKFYGINSHRCCQMSPAAGFCNQKCLLCWRAHEYNEGISMKGKIDNPKIIIQKCIEAQRKKLSGFKGNAKVNMQKWKEAQEPMHFAISLTGEPTLYPKLPELIKELHKLGKTSFLVTNGTNPAMLVKLKKEDALPTQLYVSLDAPTKELHKRVDVPLVKNAWENITKTFRLLPKLKCRKVIRITLVKGLNDCCVGEYAKLIGPTKAMVEVKAYMHVGFSRKRLERENMPTYEEVKEFSEKLANELGWKILDEKKESRVVLLAEKDFENRIMNF